MFLALLLAAQPSAWIPARWPSGDPKTLEIVRQTPINCLLLEEPFWSAAFSGAADAKGIVTLGVVHPGAGAGVMIRACRTRGASMATGMPLLDIRRLDRADTIVAAEPFGQRDRQQTAVDEDGPQLDITLGIAFQQAHDDLGDSVLALFSVEVQFHTPDRGWTYACGSRGSPRMPAIPTEGRRREKDSTLPPASSGGPSMRKR